MSLYQTASKSRLHQKTNQFSLIGKGTPSRACRKGSLTVEAAVIFPLFAGFLVSILFFFRVLETEQGVEEALQYTGRKMAVYAYGSGEDGTLLDLAAAEHIFSGALKDAECPEQYVDGGSIHLDGLRSSFSGNYIELYAVYEVPLPIGFFGKQEIPIVQSVKTRKWTGYQGEKDALGDGRFVYVTQTGHVYHESLDCSYLDLSIRSVSRAELALLRNAGGGRYKRCELCGEEEGAAYITDYGSSYHSSLSCSGLKRTVYLIRLSEAEAEGYGACSKCAGD